jgi:hypothetical protein
MILFSTGELVPETSHDLNLNLYLGIAPGPEHDLKTCSTILHL